MPGSGGERDRALRDAVPIEPLQTRGPGATAQEDQPPVVRGGDHGLRVELRGGRGIGDDHGLAARLEPLGVERLGQDLPLPREEKIAGFGVDHGRVRRHDFLDLLRFQGPREDVESARPAGKRHEKEVLAVRQKGGKAVRGLVPGGIERGDLGGLASRRGDGVERAFGCRREDDAVPAAPVGPAGPFQIADGGGLASLHGDFPQLAGEGGVAEVAAIRRPEHRSAEERTDARGAGLAFQ